MRKWHYVLSAVDNKTGFPLFYTVTTDLKGDTWKLFFQRFYRLYGVPDMIISDGSKALASGLEAVYPNVNHQLCKFHKYKNLLGRIYKIRRGKLRRRCLRLANGIFNNQSYMGRKRAARQLADLGVLYVSEYVENNILGCWHKLTKMKTSNASERWNRKIEKVTAKRYGLKTVGFVEQMMTALWLKEVIRDKRHLQNSFIDQVDFPRICQENIKVCNIIDVIKHKLLKSVA